MRFGDLEDGDKFYYNCYRWRKNTSLVETVGATDIEKNAENLDYMSNDAYFADHVEVKPITKEEEK